jgi:hypothetical protein
VHCLTCRTQLTPEDKRCAHCGARTRPLLLRPVAYVVILGSLAAGVLVGWTQLSRAAGDRGAYEKQKDITPGSNNRRATTIPETLPAVSSAPGSALPGSAGATTTTSLQPTGPPQQLVPLRAEASSVAESAQNGCGQTTNYTADQLFDSTPSTAWRTVGNGIGAKITVTLPKKTLITEVGLIAGYDKLDQCTGVDRFVQMRRVKKVRWTFEDGTSAEQDLLDVRTLQTLPLKSTSTRVVLEILASTEGQDLDYVAMSDVRLTGSALG